MNEPDRQNDLIEDAREEIVGMAKQGMAHPSTRPVLVGGAIGAIAGGILPIISWPAGLVIGAGFALYKRLRP